MCCRAVCEYYVHGECVDFAAADCKENATYCAGSEPRHVHHWREGNLPANSKCSACRRACWSAECLTGYRCEWCGSTVRTHTHLLHSTTCSLCTPYIVTDRAVVPQCHAGCRALIQDDCNFGMLQPIFLPPSAVSIPRTEVPMEAIIGVHVRPPPSQRDFGCRKCPTNSGPGKHRFPPRTCATQFAASFLSIGLACKVVGRFALSWSQAHTVTDLLLQDAEDQHRNFLPNYFLL